MKLVTADQMRALEQRADKSGNTFAMMMERAGSAVAEAITARLAVRGARENRVLVLVGPGNNGGDGLVCARVLHDSGAPVTLYVWKRTLAPDDANLRLCLERRIPITRAEDDKDFAALKRLLTTNAVIVDALLGTGVTRPIEGLLKDLLAVVKAHMETSETREINGLVPLFPSFPASSYVVAVDLPSGLNPDNGALDPAALPADLTVTFAFPKVGQLVAPGADAVGELGVADIGIPSEWASDITVQVAGVSDVARRLPVRSRESHKGTFGKAMICAGSINYIGAAYLAGSAATRAGAGLVTLALARSLQPIIAASAHETTFLPLPDDNGVLIPEATMVLTNALNGYDALLIGCGFGRNPKTIEFVRGILGSQAVQPIVDLKTQPIPNLAKVGEPSKGSTAQGPASLPMVIDADALYALSQTPQWWTYLSPSAAILTPHPGEMATLTGIKMSEIQGNRIDTAKKFAAEWRQIIVLKGARTVVAAPDGAVTIIPFATPALATAGTGDVLAGTIAAMLAQGLAPFDAAVVGAYIHGLAGEIAQDDIGVSGVVAGDLLPRLPQAMRRVRDA